MPIHQSPRQSSQVGSGEWPRAQVIDRLGQLLAAEISVQSERLESLAAQLRSHARLGERPGAITILDTNVLLHHQRIDRIRWSEVVGVPHVRLVIPLLVLDELDELDDKRYLGSDKIRERARSAIAPLDERQAEFERCDFAQLPDGTTVEYLVDDVGHRRRSNPDEELLDRAEFLHAATGRQIDLVTGDRGFRVRASARHAGVRARLMPGKWSRDQDEVADSDLR